MFYLFGGCCVFCGLSFFCYVGGFRTVLLVLFCLWFLGLVVFGGLCLFCVFVCGLGWDWVVFCLLFGDLCWIVLFGIWLLLGFVVFILLFLFVCIGSYFCCLFGFGFGLFEVRGLRGFVLFWVLLVCLGCYRGWFWCGLLCCAWGGAVGLVCGVFVLFLGFGWFVWSGIGCGLLVVVWCGVGLFCFAGCFIVLVVLFAFFWCAWGVRCGLVGRIVRLLGLFRCYLCVNLWFLLCFGGVRFGLGWFVFCLLFRFLFCVCALVGGSGWAGSVAFVVLWAIRTFFLLFLGVLGCFCFVLLWGLVVLVILCLCLGVVMWSVCGLFVLFCCGVCNFLLFVFVYFSLGCFCYTFAHAVVRSSGVCFCFVLFAVVWVFLVVFSLWFFVGCCVVYVLFGVRVWLFGGCLGNLGVICG